MIPCWPSVSRQKPSNTYGWWCQLVGVEMRVRACVSARVLVCMCWTEKDQCHPNLLSTSRHGLFILSLRDSPLATKWEHGHKLKVPVGPDGGSAWVHARHADRTYLPVQFWGFFSWKPIVHDKKGRNKCPSATFMIKVCCDSPSPPLLHSHSLTPFLLTAQKKQQTNK